MWPSPITKRPRGRPNNSAKRFRMTKLHDFSFMIGIQRSTPESDGRGDAHRGSSHIDHLARRARRAGLLRRCERDRDRDIERVERDRGDDQLVGIRYAEERLRPNGAANLYRIRVCPERCPNGHKRGSAKSVKSQHGPFPSAGPCATQSSCSKMAQRLDRLPACKTVGLANYAGDLRGDGGRMTRRVAWLSRASSLCDSAIREIQECEEHQRDHDRYVQTAL